jgi:hypothetical protein
VTNFVGEYGDQINPAKGSTLGPRQNPTNSINYPKLTEVVRRRIDEPTVAGCIGINPDNVAICFAENPCSEVSYSNFKTG